MINQMKTCDFCSIIRQKFLVNAPLMNPNNKTLEDLGENTEKDSMKLVELLR